MSYVPELHTCRVCHERGRYDSMLKTGMRHWVHMRCYIEKGKPFEKLSTRSLAELPFMVLKSSGRLDEFKRVFGQRSDRDAVLR